MGRMGDPVPGAAPLAGVRVVTTRGASGDDRLRALLEAAGARVLAWPTAEYPPPREPGPLEAARARLDRRFDWLVFTSARAVAAMGEGRAARASTSAGDAARGGGPAAESIGPAPAAGGPVPIPRVAVVGPATARAATDAGWTVAVEGRGPGARGLAARVAATCPLAGARVLFPAASGAAPTVEEEFTALGARVTRVEAYRTVVTPPPAGRVRADLAAGVDAVTFASPSAVEAVAAALDGVGGHPATGDGTTGGPATGNAGTGDAATVEVARARTGDGDPAPGGRACSAEAGEFARALAGVAVVCIGPTTGAALVLRGIGEARVAATATLEGMVAALVELLGKSGSGRRDADSGHASSRAAVQLRAAGCPDADLGRASNTRGAIAAPYPGADP